MKIVNILGGLGNQMFQYAFALALSKRWPNEPVRIDTSGFNGYPLHNGYELKRIFNVSLPKTSIKEQMSVFYPLLNYRMWQIGTRILPKRKTIIKEAEDMKFDPNVLNSEKSSYYLGYWQTEKYFSDIREIVLDAFSFPPFLPESKNQILSMEIIDKITVSIHVRRGDYLKIGNACGICTIDYYKKAISSIFKRIKPNTFLIFSDDIDWCKVNLSESLGAIQTIYVDWNNGSESYRDMQLMSLCNHNIIANSSFSWWGAWLNNHTDKIVITPDKWMKNGGWVDIIPADWIIINTSTK